MADFKVNIFGTTHYNNGITPPNGYRLFNLHILQVESDISVTNFDMFLEFYAFPFNTIGNGTIVVAGGGTQPHLTNRKLVNQPQIIHIDQMTPTIGTPLQVVNCTGLATITEPGYPTPPCSPGQDPSIATILCPSPSDYRLYSNTFQFKTILNPSNPIIDSNWSDATNRNGGNSALESVFFLLPVKIIIIADGCRYENNEGKIRIYAQYEFEYGSSVNLYGSPYCWKNPNYYPLGYDDKILVN
jgi:hypothetical protein